MSLEPESRKARYNDNDLPPSLSIWHAFLLRKATQHLNDLAEDLLRSEELSLRHFGVLSLVGAEPGHTQRALGAKLRIDRTSIMLVLDDLEQAGLLERRAGANRRMYALHLTPRGKSKLGRAHKLVAQLHEEFLAPLTPDERDVLRVLLLRITDGIPAPGTASATPAAPTDPDHRHAI